MGGTLTLGDNACTVALTVEVTNGPKTFGRINARVAVLPGQAQIS